MTGESGTPMLVNGLKVAFNTPFNSFLWLVSGDGCPRPGLDHADPAPATLAACFWARCRPSAHHPMQSISSWKGQVRGGTGDF
jgi:hypothetical protein